MHAASIQDTAPEQVSNWNLNQCIDAWAKSDSTMQGVALPQPAASISGLAGGTAGHPSHQQPQPVFIHRSTILNPAAAAGAGAFPSTSLAPLTTAPSAALNPGLLQHLGPMGMLQPGLPNAAAGAAMCAGNIATNFQLQQALLQQAQGQLGMPFGALPGMMAGPGGLLAGPQFGVNPAGMSIGAAAAAAAAMQHEVGLTAGSGPISEAARKEAAAAARAARQAKRREEKQRQKEREMQRKTKTEVVGAADVSMPMAIATPAEAAMAAAAAAAVMPLATMPVVGGGIAQRASEQPVAGGKADKTELRAIKNRESAARSRAKRVEYTSALEVQVEQLREQNKALRGQVIAVAAAPPDPHAGKVDGQPLRRTRTMPL